MMATILAIMNGLALICIVLVGLFGAINNMNSQTRHGIRIVWVMMTLGAAAMLCHFPAFGGVLLHLGIALFCLLDNRRRESLSSGRPLFRNLPHIGTK